ncbi:MAG: RNA 2',3'-cyclic phosphodiesterase [Anaerosomatales bacterium]|nr:RNA 2',3'-cyclic phosphodiesterase [Anaerosomatales bacterium]
MRGFFAIALTDPARQLLTDACEAFRDAAPSWRSEKWVDPANYHITLAFLGEQPRELADALVARVTPAVGRFRPFQLELASIVASPRPRAATMLWATVHTGERESAELAAILRDAASDLGIEPPRRPFAAHVTLVRARRPRPAPDDALAAASEVVAERSRSGTVSVGEVILCSSTLTPRGPVYEAVERIQLRGD